jgi:hypothetical protein
LPRALDITLLLMQTHTVGAHLVLAVLMRTLPVAVVQPLF